MLDNVRCHTLLGDAYRLAQGSSDPSNQNGAVLVDSSHRTALSYGRNELPPGIEGDITDRAWKMANIEHAERSAIYGAARHGHIVENSVLICPWAACTDCARAIVLSGVRLLVVHKDRMDMTPDRWRDSVEAGNKILRAGGVEIQQFSGRIGCGPIIVNGERWEP